MAMTVTVIMFVFIFYFLTGEDKDKNIKDEVRIFQFSIYSAVIDQQRNLMRTGLPQLGKSQGKIIYFSRSVKRLLNLTSSQWTSKS